jgi:DNA-binding transcriptional LysR family regulator
LHWLRRFPARIYVEAGLSVVVDVRFPSDRLVKLLKSFHLKFPTVPLRVNIEVLGGIERWLRSDTADIGIGGLHIEGEGLQRIQLARVLLIPVAAPGHPLAHAGRAKLGSSREHLQLVLTEKPPASGRDFGVAGVNVWRLGDLATKHALLLAGVGWGGMPEPMVRGDLEAGRLAHLQLPEWRGGEYPLQVVHKNDTPPGPAGKWLIECLNQDVRVEH